MFQDSSIGQIARYIGCFGKNEGKHRGQSWSQADSLNRFDGQRKPFQVCSWSPIEFSSRSKKRLY